MLKHFQYKTAIKIHPELVKQLEYFLNCVLNVSDHGTFFDRIKKKHWQDTVLSNHIAAFIFALDHSKCEDFSLVLYYLCNLTH